MADFKQSGVGIKVIWETTAPAQGRDPSTKVWGLSHGSVRLDSSGGVLQGPNAPVTRSLSNPELRTEIGTISPVSTLMGF